MSAADFDIWRSAIDALAKRNGAVELCAAMPDEQGGEPELHRTRLLRVDADGTMLVERPGVAGVSRAMAADQAVLLTAPWQGQRWQGRSTVLGLERVALTGDLVLPALRLSPASGVRSGQRRRFYRVGLTSVDLAGMTLAVEAATPEGGEAPLKATIANLGGGGMGAIVPLDAQTAASLRKGRTFRCQFRLPDANHALELHARLVHVEPLPERRIYLGLAFTFADAAQEKRVQDEIARFVTELDRKQLRRLRGAG